MISFSIFIASRIRSTSPALTASPALTLISRIVPGIGLSIAAAPADGAAAAGAAAATGIGLPALGVGVLNVIGFSTSGVAAASVAAGAQAAVGNVVAGGLFATAQSVAALGVGSAVTTFGLPCAVIGGVGYIIVQTLL